MLCRRFKSEACDWAGCIWVFVLVYADNIVLATLHVKEEFVARPEPVWTFVRRACFHWSNHFVETIAASFSTVTQTINNVHYNGRYRKNFKAFRALFTILTAVADGIQMIFTLLLIQKTITQQSGAHPYVVYNLFRVVGWTGFVIFGVQYSDVDEGFLTPTLH